MSNLPIGRSPKISSEGQRPSINKEVELVPLCFDKNPPQAGFTAEGRGGLQIHVSTGESTNGCIGVHAGKNTYIKSHYDINCKAYFLLRHYYSAAILVTKRPNNQNQ